MHDTIRLSVVILGLCLPAAFGGDRSVEKGLPKAEETWQARDAQLSRQHDEKLAGMTAAQRNEALDARQALLKAIGCNRPGKYQEGAELAEKTLAVYLRVWGEEERETILCVNWAGLLWKKANQPGKAQPYYERTLALKRKVLGEEHPDTANAWDSLGFFLRVQGNFADARAKYEQALRIRQKTLGAHDPDTAKSLASLASLLDLQGDLVGARQLYEKALAIRKKALGEEDPATAESLSDLGIVLQHQGDFERARQLHEQALAIRRKAKGSDDAEAAVALNNLGMLAHAQGNLAAAQNYYEEALDFQKKQLDEKHPFVVVTLSNLGGLLRARGDWAEAKTRYEQSLAIDRKVLGANHPHTATSLRNLGLLLQAQGKFDEAKTYLEQALAIDQKTLGERHPQTAASWNGLGDLLHHQGHDEAAARHYLQALAIQRGVLDLAAMALSERQQLAMNRAARFYLDDLLSLPPTAGLSAERLYGQVLSWKGTVSLRQRQLRQLRRNADLAPLAAELQRVAQQLANRSFAAPTSPVEAPAGLAEWIARKEELEVALSQKSETFRKEQHSLAMTPAQLQASLPVGTVLIDFLDYRHARPDPLRKGQSIQERRITAFVIEHDRPVVRIDLGPTVPIEAAVDAWRTSILRKQTGSRDAADSGLAVRRLIWQPIEKHLQGHSTVLLSPDGVLTRLPFAAIPGKEKDFLLEEWTLAIVPLPQLLLTAASRAAPSAAPESLLLIGDVDYNFRTEKETSRSAVAATQWQPLEATRGEVLAVRDSFEARFRKGKATTLRQEEATEAAFRREAGRHRWLHLATHGFFAPPEMRSALALATPGTNRFGPEGLAGFHPGLLSGLIFAGANHPAPIGGDDGILTALEVSELDLADVEMIVLSACETGLGRAAGGEGLLGLQRSFQIAGARNVVATLWSVDDATTRLFMERFYENLWKRQMPRAEALRQAQLYILREGPRRGIVRLDAAAAAPRFAPPYYWAAFALSCDGNFTTGK